MRVLHCCLAAVYIDNYSYQENILPKMHKLQGHTVAIVASTETFLNKTELGYVNASSYYTNDGLPITRLPYVKWLPHFIAKKLRVYTGLKKILDDFNPDIIFLHDCQFISIVQIASYVKTHTNVRLYIDGHTDLINSARNWVSRNILHRIIYKWCAKVIEPYTRKFYGVLPLRVDFFKDFYDMPAEKVELLVMGVDDTLIDWDKKNSIRNDIRNQLNINNDDLVFITGGKLDELKNVHLLMRAVDELQIKNIKLIVFGVPDKKMKAEIEELAQSPFIRYLGWLDSEDTCNYFLAADVAFFPGTHSVLWEQAAGLGLACIFKEWEGIKHIDVGGNCIFINPVNLSTIKEQIMLIYNDEKLLKHMKQVAEEKAIQEFSYYDIAKRAIEP